MVRLSLLFISIFTWCSHTFSQEFRKAFLRISAQDGLGLSSNNISSIYQDSTGYLWVGTANGIQRFDGAKFIFYSTEKPGSEKLPDEQIRQMVGGSSGKIWLLYEQTPKVGLFDSKNITYRNVPIVTRRKLPPRAEFTLWKDRKGNIYLNILRYGRILMFDSSRFEFNENTPLNNLPPGWKSTANVFEDTVKNRIWIVADSGLCIYDHASGKIWSRLYNPQNIGLLNFYEEYHLTSEFFIDSKRRHWYFYWTGNQNFTCFDEKGRGLSDTAGLQGVNTGYAELRKFTETRDGTLWIYGPGCLYSLDNDQKKFSFYRNQYTDNYNIRFESVNHILEDRDGVVWIATDQGLYYHSPRRSRVANIFLSDIPGFFEVTDLLQLKDKSYMVSTWGKGIISLDSSFFAFDRGIYQRKNSAYLQKPEQFQQVWSLMQHSSGKIFMGCQAGCLMIYDTETGQNDFLNPPAFEDRTIRFMAEDKKGRVWFGTQAGTVILYDGETFSVKYRLEETAIIYKLAIDPDRGWVWLATHERGLYAIDPESGKVVKHFSKKDQGNPLFGDRVSDIEHLNDTIMYAAASGVLHVINKKTGTVQWLDKEKGLPSNTAKRIRLDDKGYVWIITQQGLCHYDPAKNRFTSFGQKDGIFMGESVQACDLLDLNKNVLFAGPNSLLAFHPDAFYNTQKPPPVVITDFKLLDAYLPVDSLMEQPYIRMQPGENSFTIYFSTLSFRNRNQFTYYYKLEGADKDWVKADGSQSAQYRLLPPGKYIFKVRVENIDGLSNETITTMNLFIKPHFWQSGWFISMMLMLIAMIVYGMHRLRLTKALAVEKIRARVSRDLHDDMGSTLSTINILSSMAKAKLTVDQIKTAEYLGKISDNSQRMMEAMDDIVWAIKPDNDTMQKLIARMREFATNVLEAKEIAIVFDAEEALNELKPDMEYRRDLFLLFKEAVNNAAKYSKSTRVSIKLGMENRKLKLIVSDNGIGFDVNMADSGNGLGNMKRRAAALQGKIDIVSSENIGTTITLTAPLTV
ncbi:MAG: ATP-binding protein [Chitinophagaceae bacterium]|nr:ATP-binding protein [Chitinophagaceae bacterium]